VIEHFGGRVLAWPSAFSPPECGLLVERLDWGAHGVRAAPALAAEMGALAALRMPGGPALRWTGEITASVQSVPWHLDERRGATHKLCLYLDPGDVGTVFRLSGEEVHVPAPQGTIVLFDIALEHRTGDMPPNLRRVLGLRGVGLPR